MERVNNGRLSHAFRNHIQFSGGSMRRLFLSSFVLLVLLTGLLVPSTSNAGGEAHPLIRRAVAALEAARTDLQNAAHDYCGHRVEALEATNTALNQLQQALQCDSRRNHATGEELDTEPEASGAGSERHPNIYRAVNALGAAESDLQNAAHDYCG